MQQQHSFQRYLHRRCTRRKGREYESPVCAQPCFLPPLRVHEFTSLPSKPPVMVVSFVMLRDADQEKGPKPDTPRVDSGNTPAAPGGCRYSPSYAISLMYGPYTPIA